MKKVYPRLLILFVSAIIFCVSAEAQKKISIIGSSTSACYNVTGDSCYVGRLQNFYGSAAQFSNLAVSGSNVYRGMPSSYTPPSNRSAETPDTNNNITAALKNNPDVVLVNYPSNNYDVFSVSEVMFCLRTINETAISAGARCYITTTQPRSDPASYSTSETRRKMAEIKDSVLNQFGIFAINFWDDIVNPIDSTIITELGQGDGTHLNGKGHEILFQKVKEKNIIGSDSQLPVSFIDFTASQHTGETILTWTATLEKNIQYYKILRSEDGTHFITIETVKADNSSLEKSYLFRDKNPLKITYYQVVAVDINNRLDYSKVIKVRLTQQSLSIQKIFFSNARLYAKIESDEKQTVGVKVLNSSGQLLAKISAFVNAGINTIPINISLPGRQIYIMHISASGNDMQVKSFMRE